MILMLSSFLFAQPRYSAETTRLAYYIKANNGIVKSDFVVRAGSGAVKIGGCDHCSFLAIANNAFSSDELMIHGIITGSRTGNIVSLHCPVQELPFLLNYSGTDYLSLAIKVSADLDKAVKDTRVDSVHKGLDLVQPYTGKDVIIGITDWGFDYTHPGFYDTLYTETRILKAWDQFRNQGPAPAGFSYGTEISGHSELQAAQCDTFNIYEWATHGSHVAGICGGNGAGTVYRGVAFEANYLLATFLVNEAAVLDAFNWMKTNAENLGKRLVVNMSWGLYYMGNLDGTSLLGQAMDQMAQDGVVFVSSAGNNGAVSFHLRHDFATEADTLKSTVNFDTYSYYTNMWGQAVTIWGTPSCPFKAGITVLNAGNQYVLSSSLYATNGTQGYFEDTLIAGTDTIPYNISVESANFLNNRPHVHLRVQCKTLSYKIALNVTADTGVVHAWNVIELENGVGNWGLAFGAPLAGYKGGDKNYGVGEPTCNKSVISVAAYASEYYTQTGLLTGGTIASFSSFGPVMDGRMKPEISAPGVSVISSLSSFTNYVPQSGSVVQTVSWGGRDYKYCKMSGTSMSGPMVTGIVALMLQADPTISASDVKTIIKETAREDWRTGDLPDSGSTRWGWGKIHAWRAIKSTLGNELTPYSSDGIYVFPNPAHNAISVFTESNEPVLVRLFTVDGKVVLEKEMSSETNISLEGIIPGLYLVQIIKSSENAFFRVVIE